MVRPSVLRLIPYAESKAEAVQRRDGVVAGCKQRGHDAAGETLCRDWKRMVASTATPEPIGST